MALYPLNKNMHDLTNGTYDTRVESYSLLPKPGELKRKQLKKSKKAKRTVISGRRAIEEILDGKDSRLILIVGPCSVHNVQEAEEYALRLKKLSEVVQNKFLLVMRTYFEKPRTTIGWKGLLGDPNLNGKNNNEQGFYTAREFLLKVAELGIPTATEFLEPFTPQYYADLISWAAIGARTVESQIHREMASGLSMPVGFKNSTNGCVQAAIDAIIAAREKHSFFGINEDREACSVNTLGNPYGHVVLRGGSNGVNYDEQSVREAKSLLEKANLPGILIVDCSHGNSRKDYRRQPLVFEEVIRQRKDGNKGIVGLMLESYLKEGKQKIPANLEGFDSSILKYGVSVTDSCISWEETEELVLEAYKTLKDN